MLRTVDAAVDEEGGALDSAESGGSAQAGGASADDEDVVGWEGAVGDCEDWGGGGEAE